MSEISASSSKKNKAQSDETVEKNRGLSESPSVSEASLNIAEVRELANLVEEHGFTDFEFENERIKIRFSKNPLPQNFQTVQMPMQNAVSQAPVAPASASTDATSATTEKIAVEDNLHQITSPIVGTFYSSPAPDKDAYVKEGSTVSPDTTVCIVEAMKLMNEIQAEVAGQVVKIYVENGQPVEYGQPLFGIKK